MTAPKKSTVWKIWCVVMTIYIAMNAYGIFKMKAPDPAMFIVGWGIVMPILTNLVWWAIAFRMRSYFQNWWIWGIATTPIVGIAGFLSMMFLSTS